jgi:hypothetical protein
MLITLFIIMLANYNNCYIFALYYKIQVKQFITNVHIINESSNFIKRRC